MAELEQKKDVCFVITPIGNENDSIRRHIDGIIDASIKPVLCNQFNYEVIAAHNICEPGTITKQVIKHIFEDKLVITNLTELNPNVMYELAVRQCLGKPVITIALKGTPLPSDIIMQRTIFYQNDAKGTLELRTELSKYVKGINFTETASPIHDIIHEINHDAKIIELSETAHDLAGANDTLPYILDRLNRIEDMVTNTRNYQAHSVPYYDINNPSSVTRTLFFKYEIAPETLSESKLCNRLVHSNQLDFNVSNFEISSSEPLIAVNVQYESNSDLNKLVVHIKNILMQFGFKGVHLASIDA